MSKYMKRTSITLLLVVCLLVAGCSSLGGNSASTTSKTSVSQTSTKMTDSTSASTGSSDGDGSSTSTSETTQATTTAGTTTATTSTTTMTQSTTTSVDSWTAPKQPNTPLQNKMEEDDGQNRISDISIIHKEEASDGGYSNFDVALTANTQMGHVDPASHGTVKGEPYFLVYADGSLDNGSRFSYTNGTLIERTPIMGQKKDGDFAIQIHPEALNQAGADGKVKLMVLLMDRDSDWDDIYGVAWVTVDYSPEK